VPQPSDLSDPPVPFDSGEALAALIEATSRPTREAWHHAGVVYANHLIEHHRDQVEIELADADREWDTTTRLGPNWLALVAGYRDTLREYTQRGSD
jgi:hypothetical protein